MSIQGHDLEIRENRMQQIWQIRPKTNIKLD
jgi:hypothetical protein